MTPSGAKLNIIICPPVHKSNDYKQTTKGFRQRFYIYHHIAEKTYLNINQVCRPISKRNRPTDLAIYSQTHHTDPDIVPVTPQRPNGEKTSFEVFNPQIV